MKNVVLIFIFCFTSLFSQEVTRLQEYLPPSPEAQQFIKYGEYPVSMYTGVTNVSIPLFSIDQEEIKIPISLSYHTSGIQVDQTATWVGLGWSLNSGGMISKIPRGIPDDEGNGFLVSAIPELNALTFNHDFYEDAATGQQDTESDIYHYNFAGYSGKFFFNRNKVVQLIDQAPIDITYLAGKFIVVTKEGTTYEFNDIERTQTVTTSQGNPLGSETEQNYVSSWHLSKVISRNKVITIDFVYELGSPFNRNQYNYSESTGNDIDTSTCPPTFQNNVHSGGGSEIASQTQITQNPKRLKEIFFTNGKIVFNRIADRLDGPLERLNEIIVYKKEGLSYSELKSFDLVHNYFSSNQAIVYPSNPSEAKRYRLKLTEVHELDKFGNNPKKYFFDYDDTMLPPIGTNGKDFWGYYNGKNTNINLIPLQPFQYFGNNVGAANRNPDTNFMKAGILNRIVYPTGGKTEFLYEPHEYETTEANLVPKTIDLLAVGEDDVNIGNPMYLEDTRIFTPNYSGYATVSIEASDMISANGTFPRITLQRSGATGYLINHSIDPTTYSYPMTPPEVNITFPPVWLDKDVTYTFKAVAEGTSNSMAFDGAAYMKADIDYSEESTSNTIVNKKAGGLRISQVISYDSNGIFSFSKLYEYNNEKLITPETFIKEQYLDTEIQRFRYCTAPGGTPACYSNGTNRRFYYGGTVQELTLNGGSPVVYSSVDEFLVDELGNNLGKTNYTFDVQSDEILAAPSSYQGGIMLLKKDWIGGQNTSKTIFKKNDADFISKEIKDYVIKKYDESYKMYKIVHSKRISGDCFNSNQNSDDYGRFQVFEYPIFTGVKLPNTSQTITKYENGEELTTMNSIFYENEIHLQPTKTSNVNSRGEEIVTEIIYADDVVSNSDMEGPDLSAFEKAAIDRLKKGDLHRVAEPIQTKTIVKNGSIVLSRTIQRTNYDDWGNDIVLPKLIQSLKGVYSSSNEMQDRNVFYDYDDNGNPLEVSKVDGPTISYIWGYNKEYPVAKIENASYTDIENILDSGFDLGTNGLSSLQEANLRNGLSDAMVTTYTYDPLVGVTSMTDPRGYTITYEYDDFNRLKAVRDADGNLVSDYEYGYKQPLSN